ncbi:MAG: TlyA family RNA methyltransferase [Planctomycetes bacterium]|nr:TlyA family RNA methyltransferase [Planctomycetota bacterium]
MEPTANDGPPFVSRSGVKLAHALDHFGLDCADLVCADLGSHVGGFVECLLQRGAARVYSVDTCYGTFAWKLRRDTRVVLLERTNAMHVELPEPVDLVTIDVGWTRQAKILPRARTLLKPTGRIITLIKPQYEASEEQHEGGVVSAKQREVIVSGGRARIHEYGLEVAGLVDSPITGHGGNHEVLALLLPVTKEE